MYRKLKIRQIAGRYLSYLAVFLTLVLPVPLLHAQSSLRVTVQVSDTPVEQVLDNLRKTYNLSIVMKNDGLDLSKRISLNLKDELLSPALQKIFSGQAVEIKVKDRVVHIFKKTGQIQENISITGQVKDGEGQPVPGATVIEKGSNNGVMTDLDGRFEMTVKIPSDLECVCLGYEKADRHITGSSTHVNFILQSSKEFLDEVVVVGYGTMRRSLVSSAITKVEMDDDKLRNVASPAELLNGRIAGVFSMTSSGNVGTGERMSIRGASSITAGNEPLYVIDGIPITGGKANLTDFGEDLSALAVLNTNDIESIEILKDAASAAIYGSRATNGVVVITTKSGKEGKSNLRVNISSGFAQFPNKDRVEMADSKLWLEVYNEGIDNYNKQYGYQVGDPGYKNHKQNPFGNLPDTEWLDLVTRLGAFFNADVSFSGGNKKTNYYIGGNYNYKEGVIIKNKMDKMNFKVKVNHNFNDWIAAGANVSANYMKNWKIPGPTSGTTILGRVILQRPYDRPYKPNGDYYIGGTDELKFHNPMQILNEEEVFLENLRYLGSYYVDFKWKDKISFKNTLNTDISQMWDHTSYNENHPYGKGVGRIIDRNETVKNIMIDNVISYNDSYLDKTLHFGVMAGHSFQIVSTNNSKLDGMGFPSPSFDVVGVAAEISDYAGNMYNYAMESWFGRVNFSYKDRYILTASIRGDGSSKFAKENRWGVFPSVSLGWNISKEPWMKNSSTDLKFRASYGKTGNQAGIGTFAYQPKMSGGHNYNEQSGIYVSTFGNPDLTWEKAHQFDVGLDMSFFNDRLTIILDAYYKKTEDLLYSMPIYATTGTTSILSNIGSMRNIGGELTIGTSLDFGKVHWTSNLNISTNNNRITSLLDETKPISIGGNRALQVGQEMGAFYLFQHDGVFQYDGEVPKPQYDQGRRAGDIRWKDVDGDGLINDNDRVFMGSSNPDFFGGWDNTFSWKGISLGLFFTYMYGNDVYSAEGPNMSKPGNTIGLLKNVAENRWTGPGTSNVYPRAMSGDNNNFRNSDMFLYDGSFFRLRALTLAYDFPAKIAKKMAMTGFRIYAQIDNVFLASRFPGWDPEVSTDMDPRFFGVEKLSVPQPRTFTFGLNLTF